MLDETTADFGDVDLHVVLKDRVEHDAAEAAVAYAAEPPPSLAARRNHPHPGCG